MILNVVCKPEHEYPSRREWLAARAKLRAVGASEVPSLYGLNDRWMTEWDLWDRKLNRRHDEGSVGDPADMGHRMEPVVADLFAADHPEYEVLPSPGTCAHPLVPYLTATPDRLLRHRETGWETALELKSLGYWKQKEWPGEDVPPRYRLQVQVTLAVLGLEGMWIRALLGGQHHAERYIERDDELVSRVELEVPAWYSRHVVGGEEPPFDSAHPEAEHVVARLMGPTLSAPAFLSESEAEELIKLRRQWREGKDMEAAGKRLAEQATNRARQIAGPHESLVVGGEVVATYKPDSKGAIRKGLRDAAVAEFDDPAFRGTPSRKFLWKGAPA